MDSERKIMRAQTFVFADEGNEDKHIASLLT